MGVTGLVVCIQRQQGAPGMHVCMYVHICMCSGKYSEGLEVQSQPLLYNKLGDQPGTHELLTKQERGKKINYWKLALIQIYKKHIIVQRPLFQVKMEKLFSKEERR